MTLATGVIVSAFMVSLAVCAETKVNLESLPVPVQNTVKEQTRNAKLVGVSKEKERGKTVYELETTLDGKSRDLVIDAAGAIISVEQEVTLETVPPAAQAAIQKKVASGKLTKVETVTKGSDVSYEAAYTTKTGKRAEYSVDASGSPHK